MRSCVRCAAHFARDNATRETFLRDCIAAEVSLRTTCDVCDLLQDSCKYYTPYQYTAHCALRGAFIQVNAHAPCSLYEPLTWFPPCPLSSRLALHERRLRTAVSTIHQIQHIALRGARKYRCVSEYLSFWTVLCYTEYTTLSRLYEVYETRERSPT